MNMTNNVTANKIVNMLMNAGFKAFFVGGCVRDAFMGMVPHDVDITTNATPDNIHAVFPNHVDTGIKHGTVSVRVADDPELFEVTTFRVDGKYNDGRHPDSVIFVTDIKDDLSRRDFTINAMAFNPINNEFVDPFNGRDDIANKTVRAVGNAKDRFMEDPLRVLRAMRFAIKLGFNIDTDTAAAMHDTEVLDKLATCISKERITDELRKMLTCNKPVHDIFMTFSDVIDTLFPDMVAMHAPHNSRWHKHDIFEHSVCVIDNCDTDRFDIKLAAMFHDTGKPASRTTDENDPSINHFKGHPKKSLEICKVAFDRDLRLPTKEKNKVLDLILHHDDHINPTDRGIRKFIVNCGEDTVRAWIILKGADIADHVCPADKADVFNDMLTRFDMFKANIDNVVANMSALKISDLAINGRDVMDMFNIKSGPMVGKVLSTAFDAVVNGTITNDRDVLIDFVKNMDI